MMSGKRAGIVYDEVAVSRILGLPYECNQPTPRVVENEFIVYYGGWDLQALLDSAAGKNLMYPSKGCSWRAEPGYYSVLLQAPGTARYPWNDGLTQLKRIDEAYMSTPIAIAATALIIDLVENGGDPLRDDACICEELDSHVGLHLTLEVCGGKVLIGNQLTSSHNGNVGQIAGCKKL